MNKRKEPETSRLHIIFMGWEQLIDTVEGHALKSCNNPKGHFDLHEFGETDALG